MKPNEIAAAAGPIPAALARRFARAYLRLGIDPVPALALAARCGVVEALADMERAPARRLRRTARPVRVPMNSEVQKA